MDQYVAQLLALSNPNVSHISMATYVGELKDFIPSGSPLKWAGKMKDFLKAVPTTLRSTVNDVIRRGSKAYVSHRWAVKPLLQDMETLGQLASAVDQRLGWLTSLREDKELRRNMQLSYDQTEIPAGTHYPVEGGRRLTYAKHTDTLDRKVWGSVAWKIDPYFLFPNRMIRDRFGLTDFDRLALELATGVNGYELLKTVHNLMPWSWLIDWFTDIGALIDAYNNRIPVEPTDVCIMHKRRMRREWEITFTQDWLTLTGEYFTEFAVLQRRVANVTSVLIPLSVELPIFDGSKWSILGALLASKRRPSRKRR
jgi:hypothetical protein